MKNGNIHTHKVEQRNIFHPTGQKGGKEKGKRDNNKIGRLCEGLFLSKANFKDVLTHLHLFLLWHRIKN